MIKRILLILGLLTLGMIAMSGCAQKMAKQDNAAPSSATEKALSGDSARADTAAPGSAAAPAAETPAVPETPSAAALTTPLPGGSASTPTTPADAVATKDKDAASAKKATDAVVPLPSEEVMDTIKKMTHHPRVRYLSGTAQYSYYVGGRIDAKYDINKNELVITNDSATSDTAITCQYSNDGKMISNKKSIPPKVVGECNELINRLTNYLSR